MQGWDQRVSSLQARYLVVLTHFLQGIWNYTTGATAPGLQSHNVDIMSDHLYPLNNGM
jgi:hypothetical protein